MGRKNTPFSSQTIASHENAIISQDKLRTDTTRKAQPTKTPRVCAGCVCFVFAGIVASSMALFGVDGTPLRDSESLTSYPLVSNGATLMISGPRPVNKHTHAQAYL